MANRNLYEAASYADELFVDYFTRNDIKENTEFDTWTAFATQFIMEKGWSWWENPQPNFNVGNVTNGGTQNGFQDFQNVNQGVAGYVSTILTATWPNGSKIYENVIEAIRFGHPKLILMALSHSPYCYPPYSYSTLMEIYSNVVSYGKSYNVLSRAPEVPHLNHKVEDVTPLYNVVLGKMEEQKARTVAESIREQFGWIPNVEKA